MKKFYQEFSNWSIKGKRLIPKESEEPTEVWKRYVLSHIAKEKIKTAGDESPTKFPKITSGGCGLQQV